MLNPIVLFRRGTTALILTAAIMNHACSRQPATSPPSPAAKPAAPAPTPAKTQPPSGDAKPASAPSEAKPSAATAEPSAPPAANPPAPAEPKANAGQEPSPAPKDPKPATSPGAAPAAVIPMPKTVEEAEQLILDRWSKLKSCRAQVLSTIEVSNENGTRRIVGNGSYELLRRGEGALARMDMDTEETLMMGRSTNTRADRTHRTTDGYTLDTHVEFPTGGIATRMFLEPGYVFVIGGPYLMRSARAIGDVKVGAADAFTGTDSFVLEARPKEGGVPTRFYISLTHGMLNKMETVDHEHMQSTQLLFDGFRFGEEISPERFRLTPPPDVPVDDYTLPPYFIGEPTEAELKAAQEANAAEQAKAAENAKAAEQTKPAEEVAAPPK